MCIDVHFKNETFNINNAAIRIHWDKKELVWVYNRGDRIFAGNVDCAVRAQQLHVMIIIFEMTCLIFTHLQLYFINRFEYLQNIFYHTDDSPLGKGATSYIKSGVFMEYISASYDFDI